MNELKIICCLFNEGKNSSLYWAINMVFNDIKVSIFNMGACGGFLSHSSETNVTVVDLQKGASGLQLLKIDK